MPSILRIPVLAAALLGALAGYAAGTWLGGRAGDRAAPPTADPAGAPTADAAAPDAAAELRAALADERDRTAALEFEVEMLRSFLDARARESAEPPAARDAEADPAHPAGAQAERNWFDRDSLSDRGIDAQRAAWLNERFEQLQMAELYLRDEAMRGGWLGTRRHRDALRRLQAEALEELGEEDYDLMLFAAGRNNRVLVSGVLGSSPAASAGVEKGDFVIRYGDRRIFAPFDLIEAAADPDAPAWVPVYLWRDRELLRVFVRSGPLGIQIVPRRLYPADAGP